MSPPVIIDSPPIPIRRCTKNVEVTRKLTAEFGGTADESLVMDGSLLGLPSLGADDDDGGCLLLPSEDDGGGGPVSATASLLAQIPMVVSSAPLKSLNFIHNQRERQTATSDRRYAVCVLCEEDGFRFIAFPFFCQARISRFLDAVQWDQDIIPNSHQINT
jgi:hypothetical protein